MKVINPMVNATAPVRESADLGDTNRAPVRFDKRELTDENVTSNEFEFFQPDPRRDLNRNYRDNPFQGNQAKKVIGVGLYFAPPVVISQGSVDAQAIADALQNSAVTLGKGNREKTVHRLHTRQIVDFADTKYVREHNSATDDTYEAVQFKVNPGAVLHDQDMTLTADQRFHFTLHFPEGYQLPTASDWESVEQYTTKIGAAIQYERLT
jgi:hypothetical protein